MKRKQPPTGDAPKHTKPTRINPIAAARAKEFLHELTVERCEPQLQSPLFGKLPAELRNRIFDLVITPYENEARPLKKGDKSHNYTDPEVSVMIMDEIRGRKGRQTHWKLDTALLLTCKRAYVETAALPLKNTTIQVFPTYFYWASRSHSIQFGPGELRYHEAQEYLSKMYRQDLKITHIQCITHVSCLESTPALGFDKTSQHYLARLAPQHMTLTILPQYNHRRIDLTYRRGLQNVLQRGRLPASIQTFTLEAECRPEQFTLVESMLEEAKRFDIILTDKTRLRNSGNVVVSEVYQSAWTDEYDYLANSRHKTESEHEVRTLRWIR
jgi:hypothetical protein